MALGSTRLRPTASSINFIQKSSPQNRDGYNKIFHSINNEDLFFYEHPPTVLFNGKK
jgi:hypothetical protein